MLFLVSTNLALGMLSGLVMHRSDFCVAGMFRDFFLFRSTVMLRALVLLLAAAMLLFEAARRAGLLSPFPFPLLDSPSLANFAGGLFFGMGMVLAGGCVVGTLYKMGSGSMISAAAFLGLIAGSGLYAEIHPWWATVAGRLSFFPGSVTLPQVLGLDPLYLLAPLLLLSCCLLLNWFRTGRMHIPSPAEDFLQPWQAALSLALLGAVSAILVGMPLGITTAYAKLAAFAGQAVAPFHVAGLAYFNTDSLRYTAPVTGAFLLGGAGPRVDAVALIQFPLILGIILGAFLSAIRIREFNLSFRVPFRQYVSAFTGGTILALGSRMTPGCNVWHLFGGLPILAMQSLLFLAGLFPGAFIGTLILTRLVLPSRQ